NARQPRRERSLPATRGWKRGVRGGMCTRAGADAGRRNAAGSLRPPHARVRRRGRSAGGRAGPAGEAWRRPSVHRFTRGAPGIRPAGVPLPCGPAPYAPAGGSLPFPAAGRQAGGDPEPRAGAEIGEPPDGGEGEPPAVADAQPQAELAQVLVAADGPVAPGIILADQDDGRGQGPEPVLGGQRVEEDVRLLVSLLPRAVDPHARLDAERERAARHARAQQGEEVRL